MDRDIIKHLVQRKPFKAFEVGVSAGESFEVKHPELAVLGGNVFAVMTRTGEPRTIEPEMVWIGYEHIAYCRPLPKWEVPF
ncbi:MAG TPA: hypothetical protein VGI40_20675 [Pirellulaceae bacterium]|jgi:hypothetical protein